MRRNKEKIEKIIKFLESVSYKSKIKKSELKDRTIKEFSKNGLIKEEIDPPAYCPICGENLEDIEETKNTFIVKCQKGHIEEIEKSKRTYIIVNFLRVFEVLSSSLELDLENVSDEGSYISGSLNFKGIRIRGILLIKIKDEKHIFPIFKEILLFRRPTLIFIPSKEVNKILDLQSFFPVGSMILTIPIENLFQLKSKFIKWIKIITQIIKLEDSIIEEIETKYPSLITSISTNPKFLLTLLNQLEVLKVQKGKNFDWESLEQLVALSLSYLFLSDIRFVGYKQKFKDIPDNVFIIPDERGEPFFIGIVDCKSSRITEWEKESTEKYISYFERIRKLKSFSPSKLNVGLIFVVFNFKEKSLEKFYKRIREKLRENEYLILLPLDSLIILVYLTLNLLLQTKPNIKEQKEKIVKLFEKEESKLKILTPTKILETFKHLSEGISSYDSFFKSYFSDFL